MADDFFIHNAHVFDHSGRYIGDYPNLNSDLPPELRVGEFVVVSEHYGLALKGKGIEEIKQHEIAKIQDGQLLVDPEKWKRNHRPS